MNSGKFQNDLEYKKIEIMLKMKMKSRVKLSENKNNKEVDAKKIKKKFIG